MVYFCGNIYTTDKSLPPSCKCSIIPFHYGKKVDFFFQKTHAKFNLFSVGFVLI